jgi:hypothetical protein
MCTLVALGVNALLFAHIAAEADLWWLVFSVMNLLAMYAYSSRSD